MSKSSLIGAIIFIALIMTPISIKCQDVIVKTDGSSILAKVIKVGNVEVEYKKWDNLNGPVYTIGKSEILSINYENGSIDRFSQKSSSLDTSDRTASNKTSPVGISEDSIENMKYINLFNKNRNVVYKGSVVNKNAKYQYEILNVHRNSVIANKDAHINLGFETTYYEKFSGRKVLTTMMQMTFSNTSDKILYIDLANCFFRKGQSAESYYINASTEISKGKVGGAGVNLGAVTGALGVGGVVGTIANGVNVGGGKYSSKTVTTYNERIIAVAPHSNFSYQETIFDQSIESASLNKLRNKSLRKSNIDFEVKIGQIKELNEPLSINNTPWNILISYSSNQDMTEQKQFQIGIYKATSIGLPGIGWNGFLINTDKYIDYHGNRPYFYIEKIR